MISFKTQEDALPSALIVFSLALLVATLAFFLLFKPPTQASLTAGHHNTLLHNYDEIAKTQDRAQEERKALLPLVWQGDPVAVTSNVLNALTSEAAAGGLQLSSFRPDRTQDLGGISEMSFTVQVTGTYPRVEQMMKTLDSGSDKLVLESAQISTSTTTQTQVQATLGVTAFLLTDPSLAPATGVKHGKS